MVRRISLKRSFTKSMLILSLAFCSKISFAQVYSNKEVGKKNEELNDSLKKTNYPYVLPIWGKKAAALGFDLPYSAGIGINTFWQKSDLVIENLQVGFNNGPLYNLDEIIRFNEAVSEATAYNVRPDIWLFPFLNVYAIIAASKPSTSVGFGIFVPDSNNNWKEIMNYSTKASFTANTMGFGFTPTIGVGGGWLALDINFTWTDVSALDKPVTTFVFGPRLGKTFKFNKPQQNIALWVGGFRVKYGSETNGSIALKDVVPPGGETQAKIDAGQLKVSQTQEGIDTWWNGLTPPQQNNPVNKSKYEIANRALATAGNILNAAEAGLASLSTSTIQYSLDKRVKNMWNFIVGAQFQLNKHFMIRGEYGFLGSRQQFISGLQYRFGL